MILPSSTRAGVGRLRLLIAAFVLLCAALSLLGWAVSDLRLAGQLAGFGPMAPNTAVALLLLALALLLGDARPPARLLIWPLAGGVVVLGAVSLGEHLTGADTGASALLFPAAVRGLSDPLVGRPSTTSALDMLLVGLALLLIGRRPRAIWLAQILAIIALFSTLRALLGYVYGGVGLTAQMATGPGPSPLTAALFTALSLGVLLLRPGHGLIGLARGRRLGDFVTRWLLLVAVFVPIFGEALLLWSAGHALFAGELAIVFFIACNLLLFSWFAVTLDRRETEREGLVAQGRQLAQELRQTNEALERRVAERTAEISAVNLRLLRELDERERAEQAMRVSQERYRAISELTSDYVYALRVGPDKQIRNEWVTDAFVAITGYTTEELEASGGWSTLIHPADLPVAMARAGRIFAGKSDVSEFRIRTKSRTVRWVRDYARPVCDEQGRVVQIVGAVRDITARRQSNQHITAQQAVTAILAEVTSLEQAGPRLLAAIGQQLGWPLVELWIYDREQDYLLLRGSWQLPRPELAQFSAAGASLRFGPDEGFPGRVWTAGQSLWVPNLAQEPNLRRARLAGEAGLRGAVGVPIEHYGAILGALVCWHDDLLQPDPAQMATLEALGSQIGQFLARAEAAAALRAVTALQRAILDSASYTIISADTAGTIQLFNPAAARMLGYGADEVVGRATFEIFHDPDELAARAVQLSAELGRPIAPGFELFVARIEAGGTDEGDWTYVRKDGSRFPVRLTLSALRDQSGAVSGFVGMGSDITLRRRAEAELQRAKESAEAADRAKSAFLATMSHEIRTPLNAIIGLTGLLAEEELSAENREYVETIRSSGNLLLALINDILDFSKIEAEHMELDWQPIDLHACIEESIDLLAPAASEQRIELIYSIAPDVPRWIMGDALRLRQVLVNLLGNGVKFTEQGEVSLHVTAEGRPLGPARGRWPGEPAAGGRPSVVFTVHDTGIGIPADQIGQIFQPFIQLDGSNTRRRAGSGLGLAISQRLVAQMGGSLTAESGAGRGSTFAITLPAHAVAAMPDEGIIPQQAALTGKRLLIVDDNQTNRYILERQASSWAAQPQSVASGPAALALLDAGEAFDLAVIDLHMPEMDGVELARAIRAHRHGQRLPLVLLSSGQRRGLDRQLFAASISKPVKPALLYATLHQVITGEPPGGPSPLPPAHQGDDGAPPLRILLAEDNPVNQRVALRMLQRLGYQADLVADGRATLAALARAHYDVVLLDVQMPELDGLSVTSQIRAGGPRQGQPWIIALTASALAGDRERLLAAGMDDYLSKPLLLERLRQALARAHAQLPAPAAPPAAHLVDTAVLAQMVHSLGALGPATVREVVSHFLDETPRLLAAMRATLEEADYQQLYRHAHMLRGSSAALGATALHQACTELERASRADDPAAATALVERLAALFPPTAAALWPGEG